jgi:K+-transporting ATPase A subunit
VGIFVQMCLLAVQNFLSAAVGIVMWVAHLLGKMVDGEGPVSGR